MGSETQDTPQMDSTTQDMTTPSTFRDDMDSKTLSITTASPREQERLERRRLRDMGIDVQPMDSESMDRGPSMEPSPDMMPSPDMGHAQDMRLNRDMEPGPDMEPVPEMSMQEQSQETKQGPSTDQLEQDLLQMTDPTATTDGGMHDGNKKYKIQGMNCQFIYPGSGNSCDREPQFRNVEATMFWCDLHVPPVLDQYNEVVPIYSVDVPYTSEIQTVYASDGMGNSIPVVVDQQIPPAQTYSTVVARSESPPVPPSVYDEYLASKRNVGNLGKTWYVENGQGGMAPVIVDKQIPHPGYVAQSYPTKDSATRTITDTFYMPDGHKTSHGGKEITGYMTFPVSTTIPRQANKRSMGRNATSHGDLTAPAHMSHTDHDVVPNGQHPHASMGSVIGGSQHLAGKRSNGGSKGGKTHSAPKARRANAQSKWTKRQVPAQRVGGIVRGTRGRGGRSRGGTTSGARGHSSPRGAGSDLTEYEGPSVHTTHDVTGGSHVHHNPGSTDMYSASHGALRGASHTHMHTHTGHQSNRAIGSEPNPLSVHYNANGGGTVTAAHSVGTDAETTGSYVIGRGHGASHSHHGAVGSEPNPLTVHYNTNGGGTVISAHSINTDAEATGSYPHGDKPSRHPGVTEHTEHHGPFLHAMEPHHSVDEADFHHPETAGEPSGPDSNPLHLGWETRSDGTGAITFGKPANGNSHGAQPSHEKWHMYQDDSTPVSESIEPEQVDEADYAHQKYPTAANSHMDKPSHHPGMTEHTYHHGFWPHDKEPHHNVDEVDHHHPKTAGEPSGPDSNPLHLGWDNRGGRAGVIPLDPAYRGAQLDTRSAHGFIQEHTVHHPGWVPHHEPHHGGTSEYDYHHPHGPVTPIVNRHNAIYNGTDDDTSTIVSGLDHEGKQQRIRYKADGITPREMFVQVDEERRPRDPSTFPRGSDEPWETVQILWDKEAAFAAARSKEERLVVQHWAETAVKWAPRTLEEIARAKNTPEYLEVSTDVNRNIHVNARKASVRLWMGIEMGLLPKGFVWVVPVLDYPASGYADLKKEAPRGQIELKISKPSEPRLDLYNQRQAIASVERTRQLQALKTFNPRHESVEGKEGKQGKESKSSTSIQPGDYMPTPAPNVHYDDKTQQLVYYSQLYRVIYELDEEQTQPYWQQFVAKEKKVSKIASGPGAGAGRKVQVDPIGGTLLSIAHKQDLHWRIRKILYKSLDESYQSALSYNFVTEEAKRKLEPLLQTCKFSELEYGEPVLVDDETNFKLKHASFTRFIWNKNDTYRLVESSPQSSTRMTDIGVEDKKDKTSASNSFIVPEMSLVPVTFINVKGVEHDRPHALESWVDDFDLDLFYQAVHTVGIASIRNAARPSAVEERMSSIDLAPKSNDLMQIIQRSLRNLADNGSITLNQDDSKLQNAVRQILLSEIEQRREQERRIDDPASTGKKRKVETGQENETEETKSKKVKTDAKVGQGKDEATETTKVGETKETKEIKQEQEQGDQTWRAEYMRLFSARLLAWRRYKDRVGISLNDVTPSKQRIPELAQDLTPLKKTWEVILSNPKYTLLQEYYDQVLQEEVKRAHSFIGKTAQTAVEKAEERKRAKEAKAKAKAEAKETKAKEKKDAKEAAAKAKKKAKAEAKSKGKSDKDTEASKQKSDTDTTTTNAVLQDQTKVKTKTKPKPKPKKDTESASTPSKPAKKKLTPEEKQAAAARKALERDLEREGIFINENERSRTGLEGSGSGLGSDFGRRDDRVSSAAPLSSSSSMDTSPDTENTETVPGTTPLIIAQGQTEEDAERLIVSFMSSAQTQVVDYALSAVNANAASEDVQEEYKILSAVESLANYKRIIRKSNTDWSVGPDEEHQIDIGEVDNFSTVLVNMLKVDDAVPGELVGIEPRLRFFRRRVLNRQDMYMRYWTDDDWNNLKSILSPISEEWAEQRAATSMRKRSGVIVTKPAMDTYVIRYCFTVNPDAPEEEQHFAVARVEIKQGEYDKPNRELGSNEQQIGWRYTLQKSNDSASSASDQSQSLQSLESKSGTETVQRTLRNRTVTTTAGRIVFAWRDASSPRSNFDILTEYLELLKTDFQDNRPFGAFKLGYEDSQMFYETWTTEELALQLEANITPDQIRNYSASNVGQGEVKSSASSSGSSGSAIVKGNPWEPVWECQFTSEQKAHAAIDAMLNMDAEPNDNNVGNLIKPYIIARDYVVWRLKSASDKNHVYFQGRYNTVKLTMSVARTSQWLAGNDAGHLWGSDPAALLNKSYEVADPSASKAVCDELVRVSKSKIDNSDADTKKMIKRVWWRRRIPAVATLTESGDIPTDDKYWPASQGWVPPSDEGVDSVPLSILSPETINALATAIPMDTYMVVKYKTVNDPDLADYKYRLLWRSSSLLADKAPRAKKSQDSKSETKTKKPKAAPFNNLIDRSFGPSYKFLDGEDINNDKYRVYGNVDTAEFDHYQGSQVEDPEFVAYILERGTDSLEDKNAHFGALHTRDPKILGITLPEQLFAIGKYTEANFNERDFAKIETKYTGIMRRIDSFMRGWCSWNKATYPVLLQWSDADAQIRIDLFAKKTVVEKRIKQVRELKAKVKTHGPKKETKTKVKTKTKTGPTVKQVANVTQPEKENKTEPEKEIKEEEEEEVEQLNIPPERLDMPETPASNESLPGTETASASSVPEDTSFNLDSIDFDL